MQKPLTKEEMFEYLCEDFENCNCEELRKRVEGSPEMKFMLESTLKTIKLYKEMHKSTKLPEDCRKRLLEKLIQKKSE